MFANLSFTQKALHMFSRHPNLVAIPETTSLDRNNMYHKVKITVRSFLNGHKKGIRMNMYLPLPELFF